ncbi:hypothetical protein F5X99DRAFT_366788 [Biscogniauxia marginata]|nr:hypothetical protein F5X99DRAFT_366788 [Biscogniauxia marginata]
MAFPYSTTLGVARQTMCEQPSPTSLPNYYPLLQAQTENTTAESQGPAMHSQLQHDSARRPPRQRRRRQGRRNTRETHRPRANHPHSHQHHWSRSAPRPRGPRSNTAGPRGIRARRYQHERQADAEHMAAEWISGSLVGASPALGAGAPGAPGAGGRRRPRRRRQRQRRTWRHNLGSSQQGGNRHGHESEDPNFLQAFAEMGLGGGRGMV